MKNCINICVIYGILAITIAGCAPAKPTVVDPCKGKADVCWGKMGVAPSDVPACLELIQCSDWKMVSR